MLVVEIGVKYTVFGRFWWVFLLEIIVVSKGFFGELFLGICVSLKSVYSSLPVYFGELKINFGAKKQRILLVDLLPRI